MQPFPGLETVTSLNFKLFADSQFYIPNSFPPKNRTLPSLLKTYFWPELTYLELDLTDFTISDVNTLKETVPKLNYMKINMLAHQVPDIVWTFNWNFLPWRTGFVIFPIFTFTEIALNMQILALDLKGKIQTGQIPPVHISYDVNAFVWHLVLGYKKVTVLHVDFSNNGLYSLGHFWIMTDNRNIYQNFSHNNLWKVDDFTDRFHMITFLINPKSQTLTSQI